MLFPLLQPDIRICIERAGGSLGYVSWNRKSYGERKPEFFLFLPNTDNGYTYSDIHDEGGGNRKNYPFRVTGY